VLIDNGRVRVTRWRFAPGAATGWHRHEYDYVIVPLTDGTLKLVEPEGDKDSDLTIGAPYFRERRSASEGRTPGLGIRGRRNRRTTPRQPNRPGRLTANHERAYTRPMSNLIAKIRHWLHLDKKPKT
jgi:hypothetical protein